MDEKVAKSGKNPARYVKTRYKEDWVDALPKRETEEVHARKASQDRGEVGREVRIEDRQEGKETGEMTSLTPGEEVPGTRENGLGDAASSGTSESSPGVKDGAVAVLDPPRTRARHTIRERLRDDFEKDYELLRKSIRDALDSEATSKRDCPKCGTRILVTLPDVAARVRAVEVLINQGYGMPVQRTEAHTLSAQVKLGELRALPTERLLELLAAEESGEENS